MAAASVATLRPFPASVPPGRTLLPEPLQAPIVRSHVGGRPVFTVLGPTSGRKVSTRHRSGGFGRTVPGCRRGRSSRRAEVTGPSIC